MSNNNKKILSFSKFKQLYKQNFVNNHWHIDFITREIENYFNICNKRYRLMNGLSESSANLFNLESIISFRGNLNSPSNRAYNVDLKRQIWNRNYRGDSSIISPLTHIIEHVPYRTSDLYVMINNYYYCDYRIMLNLPDREIVDHFRYNEKYASYFIYDSIINLNSYLYKRFKEHIYESSGFKDYDFNISLYKAFDMTKDDVYKYKYKPFMIVNYSDVFNMKTTDRSIRHSGYYHYTDSDKSMLFFTEDNINSIMINTDKYMNKEHSEFIDKNEYGHSTLPKHYLEAVPIGYIFKEFVIGNLFNNLYVSFENKEHKNYYTIRYNKFGLKPIVLNTTTSVPELKYYFNNDNKIYDSDDLVETSEKLNNTATNILNDILDNYKDILSRIISNIENKSKDIFMNEIANNQSFYDMYSNYENRMPIIKVCYMDYDHFKYRFNYYQIKGFMAVLRKIIHKTKNFKDSDNLIDLIDEESLTQYMLPHLALVYTNELYTKEELAENGNELFSKVTPSKYRYFSLRPSFFYNKDSIKEVTDCNIIKILFSNTSISSAVISLLTNDNTEETINTYIDNNNIDCEKVTGSVVTNDTFNNFMKIFLEKIILGATSSTRFMYKNRYTMSYIIATKYKDLINSELKYLLENLLKYSNYKKLMTDYRKVKTNINRIRGKILKERKLFYDSVPDVRHTSLSSFFSACNLITSLDNDKIFMNCVEVGV